MGKFRSFFRKIKGCFVGLLFEKEERPVSKKHLERVRTLPCMITNSHGENCNQPAEAHHLLRAVPGAMGMKAGDEWAVPLCHQHHMKLHQYGDEEKFFYNWGIDYDYVLEYARKLWCQSKKHRKRG